MFAMSCDQRDDCGASEVCCLSVFFQGGGIAEVACATECFGPALCGDTTECGGLTCTTLDFFPELDACP
jgi:hypothetical protein